jgi:hypothetical protein
MATTGNITMNWIEVVGGAPVNRTNPYNAIDLSVIRPIDLIIKHGGANKAGKGKIWKMRKVNKLVDPGFDDRLHLWEPFSSTDNGITGSADVIVEQF